MSEPLEGGDSTAVTRNGVTVERRLERKGDGIVVTLELSADVRGPAEVDLVDEFPSGLPVDQAGFNVDHEPDDGEVSLERVELNHTVEAATETIVYAIRLSEPADGVTFDPPTIRDVTLPGIPEPDVPAGDGSTEDDGDGSAGEENEDGEPPAGAGDRSADAGAPAHPQESDRRPAGPGPSTSSDGLPEGLSHEDGADQEAGPEASLDGLEDDDVDPIENALERAEVNDAGTEANGAGSEVNGSGLDAEPANSTPTADPATGGDSRAGGPPSDGSPPETDAGAARADPSSSAGVPRSVKLRLDRLNARVEEFAAYAEALEGIIERHGSAPEILEDIESDLAEADERLAAVREEVESLESEHAADVSAVRDDVDSLESRLEAARWDLESDVADVRADLDDVDGVRADVESVAADVAALGDRVDDHEADVDDLGETVDRVAREVSQVSRNVEAMRSEVESLQDDVDRLLRFREILSDVFGGPVRRATEGNGARFEDPGNGSGPGADHSRSDDRSREGGPSSSPTGPSG